MLVFVAPMINLCSRDLARAAAFYSEFGFVEIVRTPETATLSISSSRSMGSPSESQPPRQPGSTTAFNRRGEGRWIEIVLWSDDSDATLNALVVKGARLPSPPHDFLDGELHRCLDRRPGRQSRPTRTAETLRQVADRELVWTLTKPKRRTSLRKRPCGCQSQLADGQPPGVFSKRRSRRRIYGVTAAHSGVRIY